MGPAPATGAEIRAALRFTAIVLASFAFAACGDDEPSGPATGAPTAIENPGGTLTVSAAADGSLDYVEDLLAVEAGPVGITFENPASIAHDFCIERDGTEIGCIGLIANGDTAIERLELDAGEYTYFCPVAGHREGGMEGTLVVG